MGGGGGGGGWEKVGRIGPAASAHTGCIVEAPALLWAACKRPAAPTVAPASNGVPEGGHLEPLQP